MNAGILRRTFLDALLPLLILGGATVLTELALMAVMGEFSRQDQMVLLRQPFIQRFIKTLLGAELTAELSATGVMSLGLTHPLVYALSWSFILTVATRIPAAEIERGTADLLFTLPVTRWAVYVSATLSLLCGVALLAACPLLGLWLGDRYLPMWEPLDFSRLAVVAGNYLAVQVCVSAAALLASCWSSRRGWAIAVVLGWLLASFLLEFLGQFSPTARALGVVGILHYYRPLLLVRDGAAPMAHIVVLLGLAVALWGAGWIRFRARDIPAC